MTPTVTQAVEEIRATFDGIAVNVEDDGEEGAYVHLEPVDPGSLYVQRETWIAFRITAQYPYADVYPHFVRSDLTREDGQPLGEGMSTNPYRGQPAVQVSRRSNHLNPATDTAVLKLIKVLDWMASR
jgi:hypothetical protein